MKIIAEYDELRVPEWALSELVNGDSSGLSEADAARINNWFSRFIKEAKKTAGATVNFHCGDGEPYFHRTPEFGLACNVVDCKVLILAPDDRPTAIDNLRGTSLSLWKSGDKGTSDYINEQLREIEAEHAALVAVAEACRLRNAALREAAIQDALANLATIRGNQ